MYILFKSIRHPFQDFYMSLVQLGYVIKFGWIAFQAQRIDNVQQKYVFFTKLEHCSLYETLPRFCIRLKCNFRVQYGVPLAKHFTVLFLFNMNKSFNIFCYSSYLFIYSLFRFSEWRGKWKQFSFILSFFFRRNIFCDKLLFCAGLIHLFIQKIIYHSSKQTCMHAEQK